MGKKKEFWQYSCRQWTDLDSIVQNIIPAMTFFEVKRWPRSLI
jgi:hypothetical protein